jgi:hypothetical protein
MAKMSRIAPMNMTTQLEEALALALKLAPKERLQLIELLASSLEGEISITGEETPEAHWGQSLNRLLAELGPIEMLYPETEDPVEWVKHLRSEQRRRRLGNWSNEE